MPNSSGGYVTRGLVLAVLLGCGPSTGVKPPSPPASPTATSPRSYRVRDATGPLLQYLERSSALSAEARVETFERLVVAANPDLFEPGVLSRGVKTWTGLDARLREVLPALENRREGIQRVSAQLATELATHDASFRRAFPDMKWSGTVVFTTSLDAFDGGLRPVKGETTLLFGVDKIVKIYGENARIGPLFHHELFHCYHTDVNATLEPTAESHGVLEPLWAEGLAVYVAATLNPDATPDQLTLRDPMTREVDAVQGRLAGELRGLLDDISEEGYRDFFLGAGQRADVPKRAGYLLGFRVAKHVATRTGRSLPELARLRRPELRGLVDEALAALAAGGS
ncbi:MAG: hypothetical protein EOP08_02865 [Proteobacteria bacterium]|nr:MAG: hypothetical protein EOP08_02865 [Pseudomonadota bacterium]